ncbi:MAG TPA: CGNR zinc finger domain-containing protein [Mycobacteriales bacterium]|nr:CGNR zinc finger domain-containing protein [Mycobacteriales bacterium]
MDSSGYRSDGVGLAVAIVNGVYDRGADGAALDDAIRDFGVVNRPLTARERAALRTWAGHLHNVFSATDAAAAARLLNQLLDVVVTHPYITDHDGRLHLHYAPAEAGPLHRVQASTSMGLAIVLCDYGMARLGVCRAADCECVYVDVSRNAQRRFCSESCANRTNVAAFRARARQAPAAPTAGAGAPG